MKSFYVNAGAVMYSHDRIIHRKHKLLDRGWTEVKANTLEDRDLKIDFLLGNDTSVEFIKEWGYEERSSIL